MVLHLQMQGSHPFIAAVRFGKGHRFAAKTLASTAFADKQLVDESVSASVLQAEAARHSEVTCNATINVRHPQATQALVPDEIDNRRARFLFDERIAFF